MAKRRTTQALTPDELQISINKSAEHLRVLWISYSLFAVYLIITSLSVTHRHLFLELPLRLPVLNIDLGLQDFFIAAPILFIGMHLYLVFHLNLLYQQVIKYQDIIHTNLALQERKSYLFDPFIFVQSWVGHAKGRRSQLGFSIITHGSLKVFPIFVLMLIMLSALPYHDEKLTHYHRIMVMADFVVIVTFAVNWRKKLWHLTYLLIITVISFVGLSITLYGILIFQGEDLHKLREQRFYTKEQPYQEQILKAEEFYTSYQEQVLDFFIPVLTQVLKTEEFHTSYVEKDFPSSKQEQVLDFFIPVLAEKDFPASKQAQVLDFFIPVLTEEDLYNFQQQVSPQREFPFLKSFIPVLQIASPVLELMTPALKSATTFLLEGEVNYVTGKPESLFANRLILVNEDFVDDEMVERLDEKDKEIEKRLNEGMILRKRGRHFENAVFAYSDLRRTDFTGAYISGASFIGSNLEKSNFACIGLETDDRNMKECRSIQNKNFTFQYTNLKKAYFFNFNLQGANLQGANLKDTDLRSANLQGANLYNANLQDTNLSGAYLQDANLKTTHLQGANLSKAQLQNADLYNADLQGAYLMFAQLQNASLVYANLEDAKLMKAKLQDNDKKFQGNGQFGEDWIPDTFFEYAHSQGAVFSKTQLEKLEKFKNKKYEKGKSYTNKKTDDQFKKDFLQYHAHELLCTNLVTLSEMIEVFDKDYTKEDKKIFARDLFKRMNLGECDLKPAWTEKQRVMLIEEWFFGRNR